uniref:Uncharacterized protein n=1 Tax=Anguilla anguilla TaxID=7936 RepID=A0A0E9RQV0_ANGAN
MKYSCAPVNTSEYTFQMPVTHTSTDTSICF